MEEQFFSAYPHINYIEYAKMFWERYRAFEVVFSEDKRYAKPKRSDREGRICRFCGKHYPNVKFDHDAHLFPQSIGNTSLYSRFECNGCNHTFGKFESEIANFLGISRSILGLRKPSKAPGASAKTIVAKSRIFVDDNIVIVGFRENDTDITFEDNQESNARKVTIPYTKGGYIPLNVYKAFLKSALSILSDKEVKDNYKTALQLLKGEIVLKTGAFVTEFKLPFYFNYLPHAYIFQKIDHNDPIPTHVVAFYFENRIIYFPMPMHNNDLHLNKTKIEIPICPPFFYDLEQSKTTEISQITHDLFSSEKKTDDRENLVLIQNLDELNTAVAFDPVTGETISTKHDPSQTKYMIFTNGGVSIDPGQFSQFVKEQMENL